MSKKPSRRDIVAPRFGAWIKLLRKFGAMDQKKLAEQSRISIGQVRAMERGENIGISYIQAVITALSERADGNKFVKLSCALDHEIFRQMVLDGRDRIGASKELVVSQKRA